MLKRQAVKSGVAYLLTAALAAGMLGGCGSMGAEDGESGMEQRTAAPADSVGQESDERETDAQDQPQEAGQAASEVTPYTAEADLSNVDNLWQYPYLEEGLREKLAQNGFVVCGVAGSEFFSVYEENRYSELANFVTVDSLMHTYHIYFSTLLKKVEKNYLAEQVGQLSERMLHNSVDAYGHLKGSEWENAAKRNMAFYAVGAKLLDRQVAVPEEVKDLVEHELSNIGKGDGIAESKITGGMEDYTQYKPRGYYEGDTELTGYFQAMMWYGRIHFRQDEEDLNRSALLIAKALSEDEDTYRIWESVYDVTGFFTGAGDDAGVREYAPVLEEIYGKNAALESLIGNEEAFARFQSDTTQLKVPQINSIPIWDGQDNVICGFRFMGQRYTIDGEIMQKLIYSSVRENSAGDRRMLPDFLDVPAALGSDVALQILQEDGALDYAGYPEHMEQLKEQLSADNEELWSASLYAGWLNTLRPLLNVKGEGFPAFMRSEEWAKKNLECFAGSYTELKHDTVLYSKQVMAEMGGGYEEEPDDRGYVEPEPVVYARFADLSERTAQGLKKYGMLDQTEEENLSRLSKLAGRLQEISEKELEDKELTEEEYELIRCYGGNIEHFWLESVKDEDGYVDEHAWACPAAVVVDVATDPNGTVLEMATHEPSIIYVVVSVAGKLKITKGSVYSFYQFPWPMEERLTDSQWRQMIGAEPDEEGNYRNDLSVEQPAWTASYRYGYE